MIIILYWANLFRFLNLFSSFIRYFLPLLHYRTFLFLLFIFNLHFSILILGYSRFAINFSFIYIYQIILVFWFLFIILIICFNLYFLLKISKIMMIHPCHHFSKFKKYHFDFSFIISVAKFVYNLICYQYLDQ